MNNKNDYGHRIDRETIGSHLLCDMWKCTLSDDIDVLEKLVIEAAVEAKATILDVVKKKFYPEGATVLVLLAESHISLHSWPEYDYVAIDVFTCGKEMDPEAAISYLQSALNPQDMVLKKVSRGDKRHGIKPTK